MRIVHFSDVHFGRPAYSPRAVFDKRLLGTVNFLLNRRGSVHEDSVGKLLEQCRSLAPDVVVCSGDITCVGSPGEFESALNALDAFTRLPGCALFYVPGNHDAYVRAANCRLALAGARNKLNPGLNDPCRVFLDTTVDNVSIGLVDQAHPTNIFLSSGTLTPEALAATREWCQRTQHPRILIGHFPTAGPKGESLGHRRHLNGAAALAHMLDEGLVDVYLCGHIHSRFVRYAPSGAFECCAGSLTMKGSFAIIDIDRHGTCRHRWGTLET